MAKNYRIASKDSDTDFTVNSIPFQVPLHALYASKDTYANYPLFQRQEVWTDRFKFELIDSLIEGDYVPDILVTDRNDEKIGKWVLDGQQRLQTMLHFYAALEADINNERIPCDESGKEYFYFRLTKRQEYRLRNRIIRITEIHGLTKEKLSTTFMRLQNQVSLSTAEKLWASEGDARRVVASIHQHPFYNQIYKGRTSRRQSFQMSIYPVLVEMYKPFSDMNASRFRNLFEGARKELLYDGIADTINQRMDQVTKLYEGVKVTAMTDLIVMYQSIWFLNFVGVDIDNTPAGALASWYQDFIRESQEQLGSGRLSLSTRMVRYKLQRQMWTKWLEEIVYGGYVNLGDMEQEQRILVRTQRVTGWLKNDGICKSCGNVHVRLVDADQHVFRPADQHSSYPNCTSDKRTLEAVS